MILSLIGMSGSGKTHWSKELARRGFLYIGCDDLIEQKLSSELLELGYKGISDVAKWLGQPYEPRFKKNQEKYVMFEKEVAQKILYDIENNVLKGDVVIDTSGSLIYTGNKIRNKLKKHTNTVYLRIFSSMREFMLKQYLQDPRPVIWGDKFVKKDNETNKHALRRCYPKLLEYRDSLYKEYANVSLNAEGIRKKDFTIDNFMETTKQGNPHPGTIK